MPNSHSSGSITATGVLTGPLHIPGYHFKSETTPSLAHGENVDICYGFRITTRSPIVAKVSTDSLRFEREFYIMRKLYQYKDGSSHIVRPLEYINMPSGLTVAIYADEGQSYLREDAYDSTAKLSAGGTDGASTTSSDNSSESTFRSWVRSRRSKPYDMFDENGHSSVPTYDLCTFLRFAIKCTDCLEFIHRHGVVHGELRLSAFQWDGNDDNPVKMWNFGSGAKSFETYLTSKGWRKTARNKEYTGMLQNLLVYMSPEQTGRTTYAPDHRTDIYSLGIIYFVLLTGRMPFDGGPLDILNGILSRRVPLVHELQLDVPEILSKIIEKMLHKSPDDRYTSARGVRADLVECLNRLNMAKEASDDEIKTPFPLAQHDIASVFTVPKAIYGRQEVLLELKMIIERSVNEYRHSRMPSTTELPMCQRNNSNMCDPTETLSNISEINSNSVNTSSHRKISSNSSNHFDGSDTSSTNSKIPDGTCKVGATVVGLYGHAGTGKSTLYSAVQPVARNYGYVAVGKFDSRNKVPYATVLRSLSHVLQQILSESEDEVNNFYDRLKLSLGGQFNNLALLTDFVPELRHLLNSNYLVPSNVNQSVKMDNIESKTRFQKIFVEVFRVVSLCRMTSLFLDDLHQADGPSLELIEALIMGRVKMLIFISYRDREVTTRLSELLQNKAANIHLIKTEPLTMESLTDFIADALHRSRDVHYRKELTPFASIVFRKTQGNAFYATQLLQTLERKKLIYFDWDNNQWDYDIREIEEATIYGSNDESQLDITFMVSRLRELPRAGQSLLKWASFAGDTFSWKMIKALMSQMKQEDKQLARNSLELALPALLDDDEEDDDDDDEATTLSIQFASSRRPIQSKKATYSHDSENDPISGLQAVIQEGYIISVDDDEFKWCHDRVSQAAAELVDPEMGSKIHLTIAQYLMQVDTVNVFLVADHLLKCHNLLMTLDDKERYRQIMIEAGSKGQSSGAHAMAFTYFKSAVELGDSDKRWSDELYSSTLSLYSNAVGLSWIVGDINKTEELLQALFQNTKEPIDRVPAYHVQAKTYYALQMHVKGRETLFQCLDELGDERTRVDISDEGLARDSNLVEQLVNELGEDKILQIEPCNDTPLKAAIGVMVELLLISYFTGQKKEIFYWSMRILYLSLTKGLMDDTGTAFQYASFGFAYLYHKYKFAESLGRIGIAAATKHGNDQDIGRAHLLYTGFTLHFNQHYGNSMTHVRTGMQYSLAAGDRLYAAFYQVNIAIVKFAIGYHISDIIREATAVYEDIHSWAPTVDHNSLLMSIIRAAKALQGQTYIDTPNVFDGDDGFNDEHYLAEASKHCSNNAAIINWHENYKMIPLTLYGHTDAAIKSAHLCLATIEGHPLHRNNRTMFFYYSLALIEKARHEDTAVRNSRLEQIKVNQKQIYDWAEHSPINYMMYWTLIEAELAGFGESPDILKAGKLYEQAIEQARKGSWYLELCIIHEYTGAFYYRIGFNNVAYGFISKAIELYTCHGAYGKARQLKSKYTDMLEEYDDDRHDFHEAAVQTDPVPIISDSQWSSSSSTSDGKSLLFKNEPGDDTIPSVTTEQALVTLDILDMASILKSSQVMSSEVKFQGLVKSMMNIILENTAADRGAIIIKDEKYGVCAFGSQQQESTTTYDPPRPLSEDDELVSSRIINHTIHTGESVLIHDVEQDTRFTVGPWFKRTMNKSVICMPIVHKITTVGCLFIEGPVGIFTERHITVLSLLCQQMGISITNAFLFKSVQRVTMANMRMIEMQKQALEEARRSKEAADRATRLREIFLANMSHEIRTPFSGFYGMISLLAETNLDPEQRDLVQTAKGSCEMLLQLIDDLLNFSKLRAGKVTLDLLPVVLDDTIADVVEIMIAMAVQKRINITYTIEKDVPAVVITDENRLRQVITNLLGNAIKFTHTGEIIIRCSLDKQGRVDPFKSGDKNVPLLFEVIDTGIGITEEQRKILFVPFSQVDGSTTRRYGGTGLGLSICLQLVKLMSGTIEVSSVPGQGSNFHFTIQTTRTSEHDVSREAVAHDLLQPLKKTRILVADNHVSTVTMIQKLLPGIKVDGVSTVDELLSHQATDYPIIIVGLFLTHDPEFEEWSQHLYRFLEHAQCIVVMHYPTGAAGELLGESRLTVDTEELSAEQNANTTKAISGTALTIKLATVQSNKRRAIVRMAVPLRRVSLLRTLVDMLRQSSSPFAMPRKIRPSIPSRHNSEGMTSRKLFTADERKLLSTMHVLVAEDNPIAQKLLYKQLTRLGLKVVCANDGLEAVAAWTNHPKEHFKMAFFDHHMPKCDGVEATKRIREIETGEKRNSHFAIVTLSADIQNCAREKCLSAGMDGYYTKPMSQKTLAEALKSYCLN